MATTSAMSWSVTSSVSIEAPEAWNSASFASCSASDLLELRDLAVLDLAGLGEVGLALGAVVAALGIGQIRLGDLDRLDRVLLVLPAGLHLAGALLELRQLGLDRREPVLGGAILLLLERLLLDLELLDAAVDLVDLGRHRLDLHLQARRGLVDQVDRLVGQEAVGDVALGQRRRGDDRGVR